MPNEESVVTPIEEPKTPFAEETTPEPEQPTVTPIETPVEQSVEEPAVQVESTDVDQRQQIEDLKKSVERLQEYVRRGNEEREQEKTKPNFDIPDDPRDFLTKFAEKPQEMLERFVQKAITPQQQVLLDIQRNQAVDYIRGQKDFDDKMLNEITYIVDGPERTRWFQVGNTSIQLKDLPPRQKVEAALQIFREKSKAIQPQQAQAPRPKPVTTVQSKKVARVAKDEKDMTADEFLKFHGLDKRWGAL